MVLLITVPVDLMARAPIEMGIEEEETKVCHIIQTLSYKLDLIKYFQKYYYDDVKLIEENKTSLYLNYTSS